MPPELATFPETEHIREEKLLGKMTTNINLVDLHIYRWQCRCWVELGCWLAGKGSRACLALLAGRVALSGHRKVSREFRWGQWWGGASA